MGVVCGTVAAVALVAFVALVVLSGTTAGGACFLVVTMGAPGVVGLGSFEVTENAGFIVLVGTTVLSSAEDTMEMDY